MKEIMISLLLIAGAAFILVSAIGLFKFRDFVSRIHATTKATSFGIMLMLFGMTVFFLNQIVLAKALLVVIFIYLTAPLSAHSLGISKK